MRIAFGGWEKKGMWLGIVLVVIFILTAGIRILQITEYRFPFTFDQARDMLDVRAIVVGYDVRWIGPTTSINGLFLGPFYYYFYALPFWLGAGDPAWLMYWQLGIYQLTGLFMWWRLGRYDGILGFTAASWFLLMPLGFKVTRYIWTAHAMVMAMAWWAVVLFEAGQKKTLRWWCWAGLVSGIPLQLEAAMGVSVAVASVVYVIWVERKVKSVFVFLVGLGVTGVPQLLFELKHGWMMTRTLLAGLGGTSEILGKTLPWDERLQERWDLGMQVVLDSSHLYPSVLGCLLLVLGLVVLFRVLKYPREHIVGKWMGMCGWSLVVVAGSLLVFPYGLKEWYVYGATVLVGCLVAGLVTYAMRSYWWGIFVIVMLMVGFVVVEQQKYFDSLEEVNIGNPSVAANQMEAIDWIYQQAGSDAFRVFVYVPGIYDFPYQYLFWWYGKKQYGFHPAEVTYQPGVTEYVQDGARYWDAQQSGFDDTDPVFLIIEPTENMEFYYAWVDRFNKEYCVQNSVTFSWGTKVEKRYRC